MKSNLLKIGLAGLLGLGAVSTSQAATKLDMATPWGGGVMLEYVARGAAANMELFTSNNVKVEVFPGGTLGKACLLYTSPSPRDRSLSRMPSSA